MVPTGAGPDIAGAVADSPLASCGEAVVRTCAPPPTTTSAACGNTHFVEPGESRCAAREMGHMLPAYCAKGRPGAALAPTRAAHVSAVSRPCYHYLGTGPGQTAGHSLVNGTLLEQLALVGM